MAASNMLKLIENQRADIEETLRSTKLANKAVTKPTNPPKVEPQTEKSKIIEIDPKSQMNPLALVNQLFSPEITIEEVKLVFS